MDFALARVTLSMLYAIASHREFYFFVHFIYTVYTKHPNEFVVNGLDDVYRCVYSCIFVYT